MLKKQTPKLSRKVLYSDLVLESRWITSKRHDEWERLSSGISERFYFISSRYILLPDTHALLIKIKIAIRLAVMINRFIPNSVSHPYIIIALDLYEAQQLNYCKANKPTAINSTSPVQLVPVNKISITSTDQEKPGSRAGNDKKFWVCLRNTEIPLFCNWIIFFRQKQIRPTWFRIFIISFPSWLWADPVVLGYTEWDTFSTCQQPILNKNII